MASTKATRAPAGLRHQRIIDEVLTTGEVDVNALADALGVSSMTVRRDLRHLDGAGLIRRVHGGATQGRVSLSLRAATMRKEKSSIAAKTSQLIPPNSTVGLDVGSTCTAVAQLVSRHAGMTVITGSVHAALEFDAALSEVFLLGGKLTPEGAIVGSGITDDLPVVLDTLVLGCGGLSADQGATYHDWDETLVRRGLVKQAQRVILTADHSKFELMRPYRLGDLGLIDVLVTDRAPDGALAKQLRDSGVEVVLVEGQ